MFSFLLKTLFQTRNDYDDKVVIYYIVSIFMIGIYFLNLHWWKILVTNTYKEMVIGKDKHSKTKK